LSFPPFEFLRVNSGGHPDAVPAEAGNQDENTGFRIKSGMTIKDKRRLKPATTPKLFPPFPLSPSPRPSPVKGEGD